jgi:vancomycin resistance protein VanW
MPALSLDLRGLVPFALRVEIARLRRLPAWLVERPGIARTHARDDVSRARFAHVLARHASPLRRAYPSGTQGAHDPVLQRGKERNVALAASRLDGLVVRPHEVLSYHHAVGRPSRWRGFRPGLELRDGRLSRGVGGGCCQVSNLLYLLALRAGMNVVERHRHALDLFPDHGRAVPFGCGATVFYNYADLRFENPLPEPALLALRIEGDALVGELRAERDPGFRVEVYEVGHRFERDADGGWLRENRIRRRITRADDGAVLADHEVAHNRARVLYEPSATTDEAASAPRVEEG